MQKENVIKAVFFDFDGTLTLGVGATNFAQLKRATGCPPDDPLLEYILGLSSESLRQEAFEILHHFEMHSAATAVPQKDATFVIGELKAMRIPLGIITRNRMAAITCAMQNFESLTLADFDFVITRDDDIAPKPSGDGLRKTAESLGIKPEEMIIVGDYIYDIQAGQDAGAVTVLLTSDLSVDNALAGSDFVIRTLTELIPIVTKGRPLAGE